jgi:hypothetical protein
MTLKITTALSAAALFGTVLLSHAAPQGAVAGQKLDSGLGSLPHYSQWIDKSGADPIGARVLGESIDNGLGDLPHYSQWRDRTGRDPMGLERTAFSLNRSR